MDKLACWLILPLIIIPFIVYGECGDSCQKNSVPVEQGADSEEGEISFVDDEECDCNCEERIYFHRRRSCNPDRYSKVDGWLSDEPYEPSWPSKNEVPLMDQLSR